MNNKADVKCRDKCKKYKSPECMEQLNEYAKEISDVRRDMFIYDTIIVENCKHYDDGTGIKPKIIPPKYDIRQVRKIEINGQAVLTSKGLARAMASKLPGD